MDEDWEYWKTQFADSKVENEATEFDRIEARCVFQQLSYCLSDTPTCRRYSAPLEQSILGCWIAEKRLVSPKCKIRTTLRFPKPRFIGQGFLKPRLFGQECSKQSQKLELMLVSCAPGHRVDFEKISSYNVKFPDIWHILSPDDETPQYQPQYQTQYQPHILEPILDHSVKDFSSLQFMRVQNPLPSFPKYINCTLLPGSETLCYRLEKVKFRYSQCAMPKFPRIIGRPRYPKAISEAVCSEAKLELDIHLKHSKTAVSVQEILPPRKEFQVLLNRNALGYTRLLGILDSMNISMIEREFSESIPVILISSQCCTVIVTSTSRFDSKALYQLPCSDIVVIMIGRIVNWDVIALAKARLPSLRLFACSTWTAVATLISKLAPPLGTFRLNPDLSSHERFIVCAKQWNHWQAQEALESSVDLFESAL